MNAHIFIPTAGSKSPCAECGKTYNAKAHKDARLMALAADAEANLDPATVASDDEAAPEIELVDPAPAETYGVAEAQAAIAAKAEPWGIPPVPDFVPSAEDEDAAPEQEATPEPSEEPAPAVEEEATAPAKEQAPKPAKRTSKAVEPGTIRLWVGWRITNAAVLRDATPAEKSLAAKLKAAKPTSELDRYVRLTVDELRVLDEVGVEFAAPGNSGPVVYSARTMRRRIAEAIETLEKENQK